MLNRLQRFVCPLVQDLYGLLSLMLQHIYFVFLPELLFFFLSCYPPSSLLPYIKLEQLADTRSNWQGYRLESLDWWDDRNIEWFDEITPNMRLQPLEHATCSILFPVFHDDRYLKTRQFSLKFLGNYSWHMTWFSQ